jgi:hypothetical protein
MNLSREQLIDLRAAVIYYVNRQISIANPRYEEFMLILAALEDESKPYNGSEVCDI